MDRPDADGAEYRVCAFGVGDLEQRTFLGGRALADASVWFDRLRADPAARQLWLIRSDGPVCRLVAGVERREAGSGWRPVDWDEVPPGRDGGEGGRPETQRHRGGL